MSSLPPPPTMDSSTTPPSRRSESRLRSKPNSRLAQSFDDPIENQNNPNLTPPTKKSPILPSPLHLSINPSSPIPLQELLLLSHSPYRRPKSRPVVDQNIDPAVASMTPHRKGKSMAAAAAAGLMRCTSPRNVRRARRRLEKEIFREEREIGAFEEDAGKAKKQRRQSRPKVSRKEKLSLVPSLPSSSPLPKISDDDDDRNRLDGLRALILELIMWKDVAKSTLWFGFGSLCFLSSCFSRDLTFSIISTISHLGIFVLALAFLYDSFPQRQQKKQRRDLKLTEEDIVPVVRAILPIANAAIEKTQEIFSGEPLMTLKVAPVLLFAAKYGHLITLWRLFASGFFISFTAPKLYSCYSQQIHRGVENMRTCVSETWKSCPRKRFVAASAATAFWNLFSVKTRIFAAFIGVVILRCRNQKQDLGQGDGEMESREGEQQQAMVVAE